MLKTGSKNRACRFIFLLRAHGFGVTTVCTSECFTRAHAHSRGDQKVPPEFQTHTLAWNFAIFLLAQAPSHLASARNAAIAALLGAELDNNCDQITEGRGQISNLILMDKNTNYGGSFIPDWKNMSQTCHIFKFVIQYPVKSVIFHD